MQTITKQAPLNNELRKVEIRVIISSFYSEEATKRRCSNTGLVELFTIFAFKKWGHCSIKKTLTLIIKMWSPAIMSSSALFRLALLISTADTRHCKYNHVQSMAWFVFQLALGCRSLWCYHFLDTTESPQHYHRISVEWDGDGVMSKRVKQSVVPCCKSRFLIERLPRHGIHTCWSAENTATIQWK